MSKDFISLENLISNILEEYFGKVFSFAISESIIKYTLELWLYEDCPDELQELELAFYVINDNLIIDRVVIPKRRQGIMTRLFNNILDWCKSNNISKIIIQSVLTWDMYNWCRKHKFEFSAGSGAGYNILFEFSNPTVEHGGCPGDYTYMVSTIINSKDINIIGLK